MLRGACQILSTGIRFQIKFLLCITYLLIFEI